MDGSSYCALDALIAASRTPVKLCRNNVFAGLLRPDLPMMPIRPSSVFIRICDVYLPKSIQEILNEIALREKEISLKGFQVLHQFEFGLEDVQ
jgi:hypothetical protein